VPTPDTLVVAQINGMKAFPVTVTNDGAGEMLSVSADTGAAPLPLSLTVCSSDPKAGACSSPASKSASVSFAKQSTRSFSVLVRAADFIAQDPAARIFVRFTDARGALRGLVTAAVKTPLVDPKNPPIPGPIYTGSFHGKGTSYRSNCNYANSYSGKVSINLAPGSKTGTVQISGTVARQLLSSGGGGGCYFNQSYPITASAPIDLSGHAIAWTALARQANSYDYQISNFEGTIEAAKVTGTLTESDADTSGDVKIPLVLDVSK
jgi:hypothetical protein